MHENSKLMFSEYAANYFRPESRVLEIGPDKQPSTYLELLGFQTAKWDTLDVHPAARPTFLVEAETVWPRELNAAYDVVFCAQVLEHVRKPWIFVEQMAQCCDDDGVVIIIVPCSWPYHEAPIDAWRVYPAGMAVLFEHAGLNTVLATWGCLEDVGQGVPFPGRSMSHVTERTLKTMWAKSQMMGGPVEAAFDTIGIGRK